MNMSAEYFLLQQNGLATEFMWRFKTDLGHGLWNKYSVSVGALIADPSKDALSWLGEAIADAYVDEMVAN